MSLSLKQFSIMLAIAMVSAVVLAHIYLFISDLGTSAWVGAAIVNTGLALATMLLYLKGKLDGEMLTSRFQGPRWRAYLPAAAVLVLTVGAAALTFFFGENARQETLGPELWAKVAGWVLWIPIVEELVFRVGFGGAFRKIGGVLWGSYLSVALFSFMHTLPTIGRILDGQVGFTLGTILLGVVCEVIWVYTKSFGAIMTMHAACNFTVVIFTYMDSRWLNWLGPLYL